MQSLLHGVREYLTPVLATSKFEDEGVLTPEEFVAAGDLLVYKCPTWQWASGDPSLRRPYLPEDKQFLVTRSVPCRRRVNALDRQFQRPLDADEREDGEWVATARALTSPTATCGTTAAAGSDDADAGDLDDALGHISLDGPSTAPPPPPPPASTTSILDAIVDDNYAGAPPDLGAFEEDNLIEDDAGALPMPPPASSSYLVAQEPDDDEAILYTRTYDLSITYDKYYQTPRVWLFGYDERHVPLTPEAMFEDIMQDYAHRTVTMDPHPHLSGLVHASIHPCQHAAVMKRILANMNRRDDDNDGARTTAGTPPTSSAIRSDQYLFLFLKFIQSVIPTIDYDHTIEVSARK